MFYVIHIKLKAIFKLLFHFIISFHGLVISVMNSLRKFSLQVKINYFSNEESVNYLNHKFNPNLCLDEGFCIKNHYVKSYINEIDTKIQNTHDNKLQLLKIQLKNYFEIIIMIFSLFGFIGCTLAYFNGNSKLRLRLADFGLFFGGNQHYTLLSGILFMSLSIINYYLLHFNVSSKDFLWVNLLRVITGDSPPKVIYFTSISDATLLFKLILRSKRLFSMAQICFYMTTILMNIIFYILFLEKVFFIYTIDVWLPFLCSMLVYLAAFYISIYQFYFWLCYFYLICYYLHSKCVKLNRLIKLSKVGMIKRFKIIIIKRMIAYHNSICEQFDSYNRFCGKTYSCTLFFDIFGNLLLLFQIFSNVNFFIRFVFFFGDLSTWSLIFIMNYWAASLSTQMNKLSNEFSSIQWSIKGPRSFKIKSDLLSGFERASDTKLGLHVSGFGVMTFQLFSKVKTKNYKTLLLIQV